MYVVDREVEVIGLYGTLRTLIHNIITISKMNNGLIASINNHYQWPTMLYCLILNYYTPPFMPYYARLC